MNSRRVSQEVVSWEIDRAMPYLEAYKARRISAAASRFLTSQKVEEFLEVLFALLSLIYCAAAVGFAGVLLGTPIGS